MESSLKRESVQRIEMNEENKRLLTTITKLQEEAAKLNVLLADKTELVTTLEMKNNRLNEKENSIFNDCFKTLINSQKKFSGSLGKELSTFISTMTDSIRSVDKDEDVSVLNKEGVIVILREIEVFS